MIDEQRIEVHRIGPQHLPATDREQSAREFLRALGGPLDGRDVLEVR